MPWPSPGKEVKEKKIQTAWSGDVLLRELCFRSKVWRRQRRKEALEFTPAGREDFFQRRRWRFHLPVLDRSLFRYWAYAQSNFLVLRPQWLLIAPRRDGST